VNGKVTLSLLSHTHWDREWYLPYQELRLKLAHLIDELIVILSSDPEYRHFMLDGQTVVLEDYLELRPENRRVLAGFIRNGRLLVGPWYILPDEFLVSGEALIRNLLIGHQIAKRFGSPMKVGYLPDQFGHTAQMPQILRGFGIDAAVVWRGVSDEVATSEFLWQALDGSEVFALHLPIGYFNVAALPQDPQEFVRQLQKVRACLEPLASTEHLVLMNGCDHGFPQAHTSRVVSASNLLLEDAEIIQTSLPSLLHAVREACERNGRALPVARGELRHSKRAHLLPGVLSSRMWIKQRNAACQLLLEKWAEPFTAWASLEKWADRKAMTQSARTSRPGPNGNGSRQDTDDPRPALRLAWKYLLQNQPHDSICGCSVDEVHEEMRSRFAWSEQIAASLARGALNALSSRINTASFPPTGDDLASAATDPDVAAYAVPIVVFNPSSGPRTDHVSLPLLLPADRQVVLLDDSGKSIPFWLRDRGEPAALDAGLNRVDLQQALAQLRSDYTNDPRFSKAEIEFVAQGVPGFGYRTYLLRQGRRVEADHSGSPVRDGVIANEFFTIEANPVDGTIAITDRDSGQTWAGLGRFVDGGDAGDEYNFDAPPDDSIIAALDEPARVTVVEAGPVESTLQISSMLRLPSGLTPDRQARAQDRVDCPVDVYITLYSGVRRVDCRAEVDNRAMDHRLRVHFPIGVAAREVTAETHFGVIRRPIALPEIGEDWIERPVGTQPQHSFVHVGNGTRGLLLANRGLPEYEVIPTSSGPEIALTLLRCIGWLSRDDLRSRHGHAGPELPTPGAQCQGRYVFEYALVPADGEWVAGMRQAHWFNQPLQAIATSVHPGSLPLGQGLVEIEPASLVVSAIKLPERGEGLILRVYNPTSATLHGQIRLARPFTRAQATTMEETKTQWLARNSDRITLTVRAAQIITLKFVFSA